MRLGLSWAAMLLSIGVAVREAGGEEGRSLPLGTTAPPVSVASWLNVPGKAAKAPDLKDRVVLVEFFETGCVPCRRTLPHVQTLYDRFADRGLSVVCVSWETPAVVSAFAAEAGYTMPIACDTAKSVIGAYRIVRYPTSVLLGKDGKIVFVGTPLELDPPIESALGLAPDGGAALTACLAAAVAKDAAGAKAGYRRLLECAAPEFDVKAWAGMQARPASGGDTPSDAASPPVPEDAAKALTEMLAPATTAPRREAIRSALADSGSQAFDLVAFARETYGREAPLTAKEAKDLAGAGRLAALVEAILDRQPVLAVLDEVAKAKALAARAGTRAADARSDARKALLLSGWLLSKEMTLDEAKAAPFWDDLAATGWRTGPQGQIRVCDVRGVMLRATSVSAFVDRRLFEAIVLEAIAGGRKPALATLSVEAARSRAATLAELKAKYPP